jgi:hypothetical protein
MKNREYAVEAVVQEFYGQSMTEDEGFIAPDFFAMAREILNLRAERDALLVINGNLDRDGKLLEAERDALRTRAEVAEVERGQAKMRVEAAEEDRIIYLTRWDELLNVYDAAKAWAEVTDPPRTDNYREYREASQRLLDVVARTGETCFESRRPTVTYTGEDTRARCS